MAHRDTYSAEGASVTDEGDLTGKEGGEEPEAEVAEDLHGSAELSIMRQVLNEGNAERATGVEYSRREAHTRLSVLKGRGSMCSCPPRMGAAVRVRRAERAIEVYICVLLSCVQQ